MAVSRQKLTANTINMKYLNDSIKSILALIIVIGFFGYIFTLLYIYKTVDPQIIIALVALTTGATGYYFGSSSAASKKDDKISALSAQTPATTNTGYININPVKDENNNIQPIA